MALTDNADLCGAIHEDGINLLGRHIMRQRPSLFNYETQTFRWNPERLCERVDAAPDVVARGNPLITVEPPRPIMGAGGIYELDFCAQLVKSAIDFHPANEVGGTDLPRWWSLAESRRQPP